MLARFLLANALACSVEKRYCNRNYSTDASDVASPAIYFLRRPSEQKMSVSEISAFPPEESPRPARVCAVTGRPFELGERVYSIIYEENGEIRRADLCAEAWREFKRPETALAWWSSRARAADSEKDANAILAPNDALAELFEALADRPDQADLRYALALLLTRRRVFRFEFDENARERDDERPDSIYVYSSRNDAGYSVPVVNMTVAQISRVQERLVALLNSPTAALEEQGTKRENT